MQLFITSLLSILLCYQLQAVQRESARVLPIAYDNATQEWNILLRFNPRTNIWTDFSEQMSALGAKGDTPKTVAQQALYTQTHELYNIIIKTPRYKMNNDYLFIEPVPFIPGSILYKKMEQASTPYASDFIWLPLKALLQIALQSISTKQIMPAKPINPQLLDFIRKHQKNILENLQNITTQEHPTPMIQITGHYDPQKYFKLIWKSYSNDRNAIWFYDSKDPYYEFTNFFPAPITLKGENRPIETWPTSEHYFQAQKFIHHPRIQDEIKTKKSPREIFTLAQQNKALVRPDWHKVGLDIMYRAVKTKFIQHPQLAKLLLSTDGKVLIENAGKNDNWYGAGAGPDFAGENHLGRVLMQVREELRAAQQPAQPISTIDLENLNNNLQLLSMVG